MHPISPKKLTALIMICTLALMAGGAPPAGGAEKAPAKDTKGTIIKKIKKIVPTYKERKDARARKSHTSEIQNDVDARAIKESASQDLKNVLVLLSEISLRSGNPTVAPVFMTDHKEVFGTKTDLAFSWVGYKMTLKLKQPHFPFRNTSLQEVIIGSFLYASGTNLGFVKSSSTFQKETRFYTNYTSEMLILRWRMARYFTSGYGLDSRQYFFVRRETPYGFRLPKNHVNVFPYLILEIGSLHEQGIDQLTEGILLYAWGGYGTRSRWSWWGDADNPQSGGYARHFSIISAWMKFGILVAGHHNLVVRLLFKGGFNNDFLNRPRFGATIDNARLDVVHGFPLDYFRVNSFSLLNMSYGFNIFSRLRLTLYFDYAHTFLPRKNNIIGTAYGIRIITIGGLPVWFTHGMGTRIFPDAPHLYHAFMVMTAAGW
ncbi:MAG: hypothetical protein JXA20_09700 [Spirochaetes bacterium]|nr:hypothetical protein [Spirochaetota bacterium]